MKYILNYLKNVKACTLIEPLMKEDKVMRIIKTIKEFLKTNKERFRKS